MLRCWGTWPLVKYYLRASGVQGGVITKGQREEKRKESRRVTIGTGVRANKMLFSAMRYT